MSQRVHKKGRLEVICGSMFSGKTEELMRRLKRAEFAKQHILTIKHFIDDRHHHTCITSHDGRQRVAFPLDNNIESLNKIIELSQNNVDVVGIDEVQFFPNKIADVIDTLISNGKRVIVAGLDLDFRGEPFGIMPLLMAIADEVMKLKAICVVCGHEAHHSQRIVDGKPALYHAPLILIGAKESYEARCRDCFQIDRQPDIALARTHAHTTMPMV